MAEELDILERRQSKLEDVIEKLTDISNDLNKILAVHDQRLIQQEKNVMNIKDVIEKRREDTEIKLKDVYSTIRSEDKQIIDKIDEFRSESISQYKSLTDRINTIEKTIWTYMGGFSVIVFLITYGPSLIKKLI